MNLELGVKLQIIDATFDLLRLIAQSNTRNKPEDDVDDLLRMQMEVFEEWLDLSDKYMLNYEIWHERRPKRPERE